MTLHLQQGFGKSDRLQLFADESNISGIVLSPADESPATLRDTVVTAQSLGYSTLLDPQTYINAADPRAFARNHAANGLDFGRIRWSQDANSTLNQIEKIATLNRHLGISGPWIAPSVVQSTLDDAWTGLAVQFARTASSEWGPDRTIATVAIEESALSAGPAFDDWLNVLTTLEVRGFYILVQRSTSGSPPSPWAATSLAGLLRAIYVLRTLNGYQVHWAYVENEAILAMPLGVDSISTGWSYGLRQFSIQKWIPSSGGRPPTPRIPSTTLLSSVRIDDELPALLRRFDAGDLFSERVIGTLPRANSLNRAEAQNLYLQEMADVAARASHIEVGTLAERLNAVQSDLRHASGLFTRIDSFGLQIDRRYGARVKVLIEALDLFRNAESI